MPRIFALGTVPAPTRADFPPTIASAEGGPDYRSPKRADHYNALVHVYVDDVDAHFEQAKAAGAEIVMKPTDQEYGDRRYDAKDPEGNFWSFAKRGSPTD
jgi:uncharacterized glyoxalase superfamily protein PhnB